MKAIYSNKNFILTILGRFVSNFGTYVQSFILSLYVLNQTGSATMFATVMAMAFIPRLLIGPFAGVLVDRWDRKKIIVGLDILSGIVMLLFAITYFVNKSLPIGLILAVELIMAVINTFFSPAIGTVIPTVVKKENLPDANSIKALWDSVANISAPLIGGLLFSVLGLGVVLVINALSFIISGITESFIALPKKEKKKEPLNVKAFFADFKEGISFMKDNREVLSFIIFGFVVNFMLAPLFAVVIPFILKETLAVNDVEFGVLNTLLTMGMMVGPLVTPFVLKKMGYKKAIYKGFTLTAVIVAIMGIGLLQGILTIYPTKWVPIIAIVILSIVVIAFVMVINIALQTLAQTIIPLEIFGRVGAVAGTVMVLAVPCGQMTFGLMMDQLAPSTVFILSAIGLLLSAIIYYKLAGASEEVNIVEQV